MVENTTSGERMRISSSATRQLGFIGVHRNILLAGDLPCVGLDQVAHDAVGFARIDVVRADQIDARAVFPDDVLGKGKLF